MDISSPLSIILLGRSGAGKGTQGALLQKKFSLDYIGSGDLLRQRAEREDYSGRTIRAVLARGDFAPTVFIAKLWMDLFEGYYERGSTRGFLFDGSPRKLLEAHLIDQALSWYGWDAREFVFLLDVPRDVAYERLLTRRICGQCKAVTSLMLQNLLVCANCQGTDFNARFDDVPDLMNSRLDLFDKEVEPVISYYEDQKRLIRIDGTQKPEGVFSDIYKYIA
jgi:adenylate kinase